MSRVLITAGATGEPSRVAPMKLSTTVGSITPNITASCRNMLAIMRLIARNLPTV